MTSINREWCKRETMNKKGSDRDKGGKQYAKNTLPCFHWVTSLNPAETEYLSPYAKIRCYVNSISKLSQKVRDSRYVVLILAFAQALIGLEAGRKMDLADK